MDKYSTQDHYIDPESGVLKNRLDIRNEAALKLAEADYATVRSYELAQQEPAGNFDLAHLQAMHRYLFGDIYEWAGELRTVDIAKGDSVFAHHAYIQEAAKPIFEALAREKHLHGQLPDQFSERAAHYLSEINALHPFREGNGRVQREFISLLARKNGYLIEWRNIEAAEMLEASIRAFKGEAHPLARIIRRNLKALGELGVQGD